MHGIKRNVRTQRAWSRGTLVGGGRGDCRSARFLDELAGILRAAGIAAWPSETVAAADRAAISERIERVLDYTAMNIGEAITVEDLARIAGLSRFHFTRVFREEVGRSPWSYVREARVVRARELLEAGRPPAEVALETGFSDQSHLTRTLRTVYGRTPTDLRRAGARSGPGGLVTTDGTNVQDIEPPTTENDSETESEESWNQNPHGSRIDRTTIRSS